MTVSGIVHVTRVWQKRLKDVLTDPLHALTFEGPGKMACLGFEFGEPIRTVTDLSPPQSYDGCEAPITKKIEFTGFFARSHERTPYGPYQID
jgi:hypothetical protein